MYAGYNKGEHRATRLGNWMEERALEEATGSNRLPKNLSQCGIRTIGEGGYGDPGMLSSTYREAHKDPNAMPNFQAHEKEGVRERAEMRRMKQLVDEEFAEAELARETLKEQRHFQTSHRDEFTDAPIEKYLEARSFRTTGPKKDPKHVVDLPEKHYTEGTTITMYTEALEDEQLGESQKFPRSFIANSVRPFGKSSAFSSDIRDGRKFNMEAHEQHSP